MTDWTDRVAVVTGAANGIGFGIAQRFHDEGLRVVLADYDADALDAAVASLGGDPDRVLGVRTDVSLADDVDELARRAKERFGAVDVLVNNAGVNAYGFMTWELPQATWDWVFGVNFFGAVNGIRSFLPGMIEQGRGHVISTASGAALLGAMGRSAYVASKHALLGMSESLFYELADAQSPVRVSVLIPGIITTTIRDSGDRWPERLGPRAALGPQGNALDLPQTAEFGAKDPSVPAAAVWDALQTGLFLINLPTTGLNILRTRVLELSGINPRLEDQTAVNRPGR